MRKGLWALIPLFLCAQEQWITLENGVRYADAVW